MAGAPWEKYAQQAPQADPVIAVDPYRQAAEQRAQQDQALQAEAAARDAERLRLAQENATLNVQKQNNGTEAQGKAAGMLERAIGANKQFEDLGVGARSYIGQKIANAAPDVKNMTDSPTRQQAVAAQRDFISAVLRVESGAAISPSEFDNYSKLFFPQPGDSEETLQAKAQSRRRAMEALQLQAGPLGKGVAIPGLPRSDTQNNFEQQDPAAIASQGLNVEVTDTGPAGSTPPSDGVAAEAQRLDNLTGQLGYLDLAKQGLTLGLTDEASGVGAAIGKALGGDFDILKNYRTGRDAQELRLNQARERLGVGGQATEMLGSLALPANALAGSLTGAVRGGAIAGATGGFGYGRGYEQSTQNALLGAAGGAALGYGGQRLGNALAARTTARDLPQRATALDAAGQAEGVTVNRAMVDPQSNNAVTKTDATLIGGRRLQRDMGKIEGQVEGRVQALGQGGQPMDKIATGDTVKGAGLRFIDKSGKAAARKYDRAEQLAGDAKVTPNESLRRTDEMIAQLSETPDTNATEIAYLQGLKKDLSKDLSVGGLRRMRTKLRQKISKGDLTFGEDEARVLSIMDGAAEDIRAGLTAQGKQAAAKAFEAADNSYRARMEYINSTIQKLIGKRNANLSAEQIAGKFNSLAKSDARGLRDFYATLTPGEQADVAATVAEELGRNNKGDFTVSQFLRQTSEKNLSPEAARTIFGPQGAESIKNLRLLGKEIERVTGAMNSRTSKSGIAAGNYREWLYGLIGSGTGLASEGGATGAAAGLAAGAVVKGAKDILSARALMSPKIQKWILQAPRTANPAVIDRHFERLGEIAKAEPALAGEIDNFRQAIMRAANDNVGVSAAAGDRKENQQQQ